MSVGLRYAIYDQNIISDVFGEEAVLVNLESGIYYSLRGSSSHIWIRLINQYSPIEILADLIQVYKVAESDLAADIHLFVARLLELRIIKTSTVTERRTIDPVSECVSAEYAPPVVEVFSDMQEILLLDPVHDVDKAGWPITKNTDNPPR
jgi:hypothetical protein